MPKMHFLRRWIFLLLLPTAMYSSDCIAQIFRVCYTYTHRIIYVWYIYICIPFQAKTILLHFSVCLILDFYFYFLCACEFLGYLYCISPGRLHLTSTSPSVCRHLLLHVFPGFLETQLRKKIYNYNNNKNKITVSF